MSGSFSVYVIINDLSPFYPKGKHVNEKNSITNMKDTCRFEMFLKTSNPVNQMKKKNVRSVVIEPSAI